MPMTRKSSASDGQQRRQSQPDRCSCRQPRAPAPHPARHEPGEARRGDRPDLPAGAEIRARRQSHRLEPAVRSRPRARRAGLLFLRRHVGRASPRIAEPPARAWRSAKPQPFEPDPMAKRETLELVRAYYRIDRRPGAQAPLRADQGARPTPASLSRPDLARVRRRVAAGHDAAVANNRLDPAGARCTMIRRPAAGRPPLPDRVGPRRPGAIEPFAEPAVEEDPSWPSSELSLHQRIRFRRPSRQGLRPHLRRGRRRLSHAPIPRRASPVETLATTNRVVLAGEVRGPGLDHARELLEEVARQAIKDIGYEQDGFHWKKRQGRRPAPRAVGRYRPGRRRRRQQGRGRRRPGHHVRLCLPRDRRS